ncbi:hypothetical protein [Streptomyces sp. bgisy100]|uniref:restriction endonuclease-related protein n=1 Tax=Streptomyces sp. bgisy100 TaxID=3413783 RepID=UPI003D726224
MSALSVDEAGPERGAAVWEDDYILLALLSHGLVEMNRRLESLGQPRHPWSGAERRYTSLPGAWQEAVTRLWWRFFWAGLEPPRNDYAVLELCRVPPGRWPLPMALSAADADVCLLEGDEPSEFAEEAVRGAWGDPEAHLAEHRVHQALLLVAEANARERHDAWRIYVRLRRLVIERPVISDLDVQALQRELPTGPAAGEPYVMEFVRAVYERRPAENGVTLAVCARCGVPLSKARGKRKEDCGTPGCETGYENLRLATLGFYWVLHRGARRFVHDAGVFELRVCDNVRALGLEPLLWLGTDQPDALDVCFRVPRGKRSELWGTDEKDWASPVLLARSFRWPIEPECDRRFLVVPEHRAQVPGYLTDLRTELAGRTDPARPFKVVTEKQLLTEVRRALARQGGNSCAR